MPDAPPPPTWEPLAPLERRVLGVLVEKQKTSKTADAYPLTLNALVTGCNQKSNRDPVLELSDDDVEEVCESLQKKGLIFRLTGGRADRWRHNLYDAWKVAKVEMAVLAELLLRGPQTEGDLRGRAARMDPIDDLDALRTALKPLVERKLVVYLTPANRRGAVLTYGFHPLAELERLRAYHSSQPAAADEDDRPQPFQRAAAPPQPSITEVLNERLAPLESRLTALLEEIGRLRAEVSMLTAELAKVKAELGLPPAS